jgi:hypothetical protein
MRQRSFKRVISSAVTVALICVVASPALAQWDSTTRSILFPGSGQASEGHYGKAVIFAGAAVVTGVGWFLSQVHYDQSVRRYNDLRDLYVGYPDQLESGVVIPYSDIESTYGDMREAYEASEDRQVWRNAFMGSFLIVYALNLVDILMSKPETGERTPEEATGAIGFKLQDENFLVYKDFRF